MAESSLQELRLWFMHSPVVILDEYDFQHMRAMRLLLPDGAIQVLVINPDVIASGVERLLPMLSRWLEPA